MDTSSADFTLPHNPTTGRFYAGGNIEALLVAQEAAGYGTAEWAGFGQWKKAGRVVSKGQTNTAIIYMVPKIDKKTKKPVMKNGKPVLIKRTLRVFNMAQTEMMKSKDLAAAAPTEEEAAIARKIWSTPGNESMTLKEAEAAVAAGAAA